MVLKNIRTADEVADDYGLNIWLYGPKGGGKTSLGATLAQHPLGAPLLDIDSEGGAGVLSGFKQVFVEPARDWLHLQEIYIALLEEEHPFKSVQLDNISDIYEIAKKYAVDTSDDPSQKGNPMPTLRTYGVINQMMLRLIRAFRGLGSSRNMNVVFISWDTREKDEHTGQVFTDLALSPKIQEQAPGIVDISGYLYVPDQSSTASKPTDDYKRVLQLQGTRSIPSAKFRRRGALAWTIPNVIDQPTLAPILEVMKGGATWNEAIVKYPFVHPRDLITTNANANVGK